MSADTPASSPATSPEASPAASPQGDGLQIAGSWELARTQLAREFPEKKEGILFCIWKLRQDPRTTLADFRDEAKVRGVSLGGRSLHSAKVALGWEQPSRRRSKTEIESPKPAKPRSVKSSRPEIAQPEDDLELQVLENFQRIRAAASGESERLKDAIREAIRVLQNALDEGS